MANPPRYPDSKGETGDDTGVGTDRGAPTGTPRWVKVFGIIALVVILLFVFQLVTEGPMRPGMPGMHSGGGNAPSSSVTALGADGGHG